MPRVAALAGAFTATLIASSLALAGFSSSSSAGNTVATKRIFPGARATAPHQLTDRSSGTAVATNDALSYADAVIKTTGNWSTAFSSTRYVQFNLNDPLPAGVPVSAANFNFRITPSLSTDTACYYFEVRRQSDNGLLGTHFSSGSPQCVTGATYNTISTALSEVTTSTIADNIYVKVFARNSGSRPIRIDLATVTLTEFSTAETLFQETWTDASTGTATTTAWPFDLVDAVQFTIASTWTTAFSSTRYLQYTYPAYLPSGAVVTGATLTHSYKSATAGDTTCHYFEVYASTTLIGTHGSSTTPYSCNSTTSFVTDTVSLPEVNTAAEANTVVIRDYVRNTGARKSSHDVDRVTLTYSLD